MTAYFEGVCLWLNFSLFTFKCITLVNLPHIMQSHDSLLNLHKYIALLLLAIFNYAIFIKYTFYIKGYICVYVYNFVYVNTHA